ncbi:MAG: hypothetical protein CV087_23620 [Candidatus Brocadia sp. WS118]|nr:MAG: hypothetical protein CV087_23620 [Candidatus Brocadia sp. WS118]
MIKKKSAKLLFKPILIGLVFIAIGFILLFSSPISLSQFFGIVSVVFGSQLTLWGFNIRSEFLGNETDTDMAKIRVYIHEEEKQLREERLSMIETFFDRERVVGEEEKNKFIFITLANLHNSLKWLWQVIMAIALVSAVWGYSQSLNINNSENIFDFLAMFLNIELLVFTSFILAFIRFYFGDSRYLDISYSETLHQYGLEIAITKFSGTKSFLDILLLLTHGMFICLMSFYINAPLVYLYFFVGFLIANVIWLTIQYRHKFHIVSSRERLYREAQKKALKDPYILQGGKPLKRWSINNSIFIVLLLIVILYNIEPTIHIGITLCILNSLFDFIYTWRYYFPNLSKLYESKVLEIHS